MKAGSALPTLDVIPDRAAIGGTEPGPTRCTLPPVIAWVPDRLAPLSRIAPSGMTTREGRVAFNILSVFQLLTAKPDCPSQP